MYDCIIIGGGPAALSASIYLKNANKNVLILEKNTPGGKILKTNKITNYLGFTGENASDLAYKMYEQTQKLDIPILIEKVIDIKDNESFKQIITEKNIYQTKSVIIACGRIENTLSIENEEKLTGKGISYCVKCDANLYKDKQVMLLGADNALDDAIYLSNIASKVIYVNYSNENIDLNKENIQVINKEKVVKINEKNNVIHSVTLSNDEEYIISCLFIETGYTPNISFIKSLDIETKNDYILTDDEMRTSIKGIYAAGDIVYKKVYQVINAASEGALSALTVIKDLR